MRKIYARFCNFAIELDKKQSLQHIIDISEKKMECKTFQQNLTQQINKYSSLGQLVNVNINQHTNIQEELQIRTVPFVALVYQNSFVDVYQKNGNLENFLTSINNLYRQLTGEEQAEQLLVQLSTLAQKEEGDQIIEIAQKALQNEKLKNFHPQFLLHVARGHIFNQELSKTKEILDQFKSNSEDEQQLYENVLKHYKQIKELLEMPKELVEKLIKLDQNPDDKELRFEIAEDAYAIQNIDLAMDMLLDIVRLERNWCERKAQLKLQEYFSKLGSQHNCVQRGRIELAQLLYQ